MDRIVRNPREGPIAVNGGEPPFNTAIEPGPHVNRFKLLPWLAGVFCIITLIYGSSYLALLWLPPHPEVDMRSQLTADYSPWDFLVFQPVDPAIIEEIRQEQDLPEQLIIDGSFWPTLSTTNIPSSSTGTQQQGSTPATIQMPTSTPLATFINQQSSPTIIQPFHTSTSMPTGITSLPEPADTPKPTATLRPTKPSKPTRPPKPTKPPKPDK
jgi:hypothetical protein